MEMKFDLVKQPSHSKGWVRYRVTSSTDTRRVVESRTGNEWVSASHHGQVAPGERVEVVIELMLITQRTRRESRQTFEYSLVADPTASCMLGNIYASYFCIQVDGARLDEEVR